MGAMNDWQAIVTLLYRYAEAMDAGDLAGAAALFSHARLKLRDGQEVDAAGIEAVWRRVVRLYPCGTPRTRHVVTNPIIEVAGDTATARSCYTVLQSVTPGAINVIAAGRYHDRFERAGGVWRFAFRDYGLFDFQGDLTQHLVTL